MSCATSCLTQDHKSMGECLRNQGIRVAYCNTAGGFDYTSQKRFDKNLDAYADARRQGIQPASTRRNDVNDAVILSDISGKAFQS